VRSAVNRLALVGALLASLSALPACGPAEAATSVGRSPAGTSSATDTRSVALARARALLGPTVTVVGGTEFDSTAWYRTTLLGGGTVTPSITDRGGVVTVSTTTGANRIASLQPAGTLNLIGSPRTDLWYVRWRAIATTTIDANGQLFGGLMTETLGNPQITMGLIGSVSTTNFAYLVTSNAAATTASGSTGIPIDTAYHLFEEWSNGTTISFAIDGNVVATTAATNAGTVGMTPNILATNGATVTARSIKVDHLWICTAPPAT
jgi:hypothetical protein